MAYTIADARACGLRAGMEPADPPDVPEQFRHSTALTEAWQDAYRSMLTATSQRPGVRNPEPTPEPKPKPRKAPRKKSMSAILAEHAEHLAE